ncbi:clostripain-related cysteine peptidase [Bacteroides sp. 1001136B_160425_E2]|uniref:clostripain-related cysteine peptidase n=1 Tax=Bacteroides sp. 1001136B_160425_E2 TaxID=2787083 RepID=UPI00189CA364|nr:clostripain-related cysteine peptidase [Bacteroides sp. 1001136B_160425_E2]
MKKIKILSLLFCVAILAAACHDDEEGPIIPQPREQVGRTVLVYIVGDNGVSELSDLFKINFEDMKEGMKEVDYSKCNLVVYSEMVNDVPRLVSLKKQNGKVVADTLFTYSEQNPLAKEVMSSVISQTVSYFPADSYGFVFLSHSSSWVPATNDANSRSIGYYRRTQMNIPDFHDVLLSSFPRPLKFILFDSCSMQAVEVAYELRDCAEYFIGSPTEIPGPGAPYSVVVPEMFTENNLAINIASAYFNYYEKFYTGKAPSVNTNWTGGVATSVINSAALDNLAMVVKTIIPKYIKDAEGVQCNDIQLYDFSSDKANYDFDNLIQNLTGGKDNTDYQSWRQAFDEAVIYRKTTPKNYSGITYTMFSMEKAEGLSTYIPRGSLNSKMNNFYRTLQWYSAAGWDETGW